MIDVDKFCGSDNFPKGIQTPFSIGDYTFATDGQIIIKVDKLPEVEQRDDAPDANRLEWRQDEITEWHELPMIDFDELDDCANCWGIGFVKTCPECDGDSVVYFENTYNCYETECQTCCGNGILRGNKDDKICGSCNGTKKQSTSVKVGSASIGSVYLSMIYSLPDAVIEHSDKTESMVNFKFNGGCGIVMPRRD